MDSIVLSDKAVKPNDEIIFSIIGEKDLLWKQTFSFLYDNSKDISVEWKYSDCGKEWFCQALKKKKSLFWIKIVKDSFRISFCFGDKLEPIVLQSGLPESIKTDYKNAKRLNKARWIYIDMADSKDFESVKKLIDLKLNN